MPGLVIPSRTAASGVPAGIGAASAADESSQDIR